MYLALVLTSWHKHLELQAQTPAPVQNENLYDDDDEPLNEDDDDELDDAENAEEMNTTHLVLAQFDKVLSCNLCEFHLMYLWFDEI